LTLKATKEWPALPAGPDAVNEVLPWTNRDSFRPMERLFTTWLTGARLVEIARVVQLAKAELGQRGITLAWSISQTDDTTRSGRND